LWLDFSSYCTGRIVFVMGCIKSRRALLQIVPCWTVFHWPLWSDVIHDISESSIMSGCSGSKYLIP